VLDSIAVIDRVLKRDLPQGPCWRRYNHDAYGQKDDGSAYDGTGVGRSWPILTGERGHYELGRRTRSAAVYQSDGKVRQRRRHDHRAALGRR